jgi:rhamnose transport system permease protein
MVIIAGEIDLSPASMMALSACLFAVAFRETGSIPAGIAASLVSGLVMGAFNGVLVTVFKLPSIIVTIGTLTLYRGLAQVLVGDKSVGSFPGWFVGIDFDMVGIVPVPVIIFAAASIVLGLVLSVTIYGRQIYQIGTNEIAARHAGIRVARIKMGLFLASGLTSAIAGLLTASRLGSVRYDLAAGGELQMVLIVMLGGTYIFGGRGTILGTFLAAWLLVILATGMTVANISITSQLTVMGLLLIVAIIATNFIYSRSQR